MPQKDYFRFEFGHAERMMAVGFPPSWLSPQWLKVLAILLRGRLSLPPVHQGLAAALRPFLPGKLSPGPETG